MERKLYWHMLPRIQHCFCIFNPSNLFNPVWNHWKNMDIHSLASLLQSNTIHKIFPYFTYPCVFVKISIIPSLAVLAANIFFTSPHCSYLRAIMWGLQAFGEVLWYLLDWPWWQRTPWPVQSQLQYDRCSPVFCFTLCVCMCTPHYLLWPVREEMSPALLILNLRQQHS